jgi:hypothetical protein
MYTQNKVIENIFFKYFKVGSKVIGTQRYSENATLHFALSHNALSQQNKIIVAKHYGIALGT